jgi:hypothetical protein
MLSAYVNYPNAHISVHSAAGCASIQQQRKTDQRVVQLDPRTLSGELLKFEEEHRFASEQRLNDMWLLVNFGDIEFERAVVEHVRKVLARRYKPFAQVEVSSHC